MKIELKGLGILNQHDMVGVIAWPFRREGAQLIAALTADVWQVDPDPDLFCRFLNKGGL